MRVTVKLTSKDAVLQKNRFGRFSPNVRECWSRKGLDRAQSLLLATRASVAYWGLEGVWQENLCIGVGGGGLSGV